MEVNMKAETIWVGSTWSVTIRQLGSDFIVTEYSPIALNMAEPMWRGKDFDEAVRVAETLVSRLSY
jgi:hypothetical protein